MNEYTLKTIFISYAKEDKEIAHMVYIKLKDHGFNPWIDIIDLMPGQNWKIEIKKKIKESNFFIAILSNNSVNKRGYVQKELKLAIDTLDEFPSQSVYLIPLKVDDCVIQDEKINNLHWVKLSKPYDTGILKLINSISFYINDPKTVNGKSKKTASKRNKGIIFFFIIVFMIMSSYISFVIIKKNSNFIFSKLSYLKPSEINNNFCLVAGKFINKNNANNLLEKLKKYGLDSSRLINENERFIVIIDCYQFRNEAIDEAERIKIIHNIEDIWIQENMDIVQKDQQ